MAKDNLADLPDDIFLDIVEHLQSARDVARLGATSRRANDLIERDGWVPFVKRHFPTVSLPPVEPGQWRGVADRLTYLDKCWEKRGFALSEYTERKQSGHGGVKKQSVAPSTVVHASLLAEEQKECVAWGAGENLVVQTMPCHGRNAHKKRRWHEQHGASQGYSPGTGDITSLSIIDRQPNPQIAVGRANGSLRLQSLRHGTFGQAQQELDLPVTKTLRTQGPSLPSPGQSAVSWTEWNSQADLLATGQSSTVALFDLKDVEADTLAPVVTEKMCTNVGGDLSLIRSIKFINQDTLAVALGASAKPLRCAKITPTGLVFTDMNEGNWKIRDTLRLHNGPEMGEKTTVRAIEPVGDGRHIRTPSAYDAVYCNRLLPYEAGSSLLVYGMERFVAGSNSRPNVFFFDFRQPKAYHWSAAAACSSEAPYPPPPDNAFVKNGNGVLEHGLAKCRPEERKMCLWHRSSLSNTFRPDATLMIGDRQYDRVHTLASASATSPSFWVGLRGGVFESRFMLAEDAAVKNVKGSAPPSWQVGKPEPKITLVETGMGMRYADDWSDSRWAVNVADWEFRFRKGRVKERERRARLDPSVSRFKTREGA
ncbi:hypothetical protein NLU13_9842 [Sarocladium strictum]|uniref:F-box domain-containing protein n=1 Tax=Sarocladium strictum TaxID=5046 RepID=A0AA39G918_SARSR|nr:hypothetical protein NLU13_9842 [Sarocladium strictum]